MFKAKGRDCLISFFFQTVNKQTKTLEKSLLYVFRGGLTNAMT